MILKIIIFQCHLTTNWPQCLQEPECQVWQEWIHLEPWQSLHFHLFCHHPPDYQHNYYQVGMNNKFSKSKWVIPICNYLGARPPLLPTLPHLTPNLYEVAALTQEFDTTVITNKVKELLLANNIGQKLFGEAVLGMFENRRIWVQIITKILFSLISTKYAYMLNF